eukprot:SAG31_NODE_3463_length_4245_cov_2.612397_2_plen_198_part_00
MYYDATADTEYLQKHLGPFLRGVARFYTTYSVPVVGGGVKLPYTCPQEVCGGVNKSRGTVHNAHQDVAYAKMVFAKLLQYTDGSSHNLTANTEERSEWQRMLAALPPYPSWTNSTTGRRAFADSSYADGSPNYEGNAGYAITYHSAIYPAQNIGSLWSSAEELDLARNTLNVLYGNVTGAAKNSNFSSSCECWPQSC